MEKYWFVDYLGYEENQKQDNRLIISFRDFSNNTGTIYLRKPITITSRFLNREGLEKVVSEYKESDFSQYPLTVYLAKRENDYGKDLESKDIIVEKGSDNFSVVNITLPYNRELINQLSSKFQKGNYNKLIRMQYDILNRKVILDERLEEVFVIKNKIDSLQDELNKLILEYYDNKNDKYTRTKRTRLRNEFNEFFSQYKGQEIDYEILRDELSQKKFYGELKRFADFPDENIIEKCVDIHNNLRKLRPLFRKIDLSNYVYYDEEKDNYELYFNSENGIKFLNSRLSLDEFQKQVFCVVDIEKPLFKEKDEKILIDRKNYVELLLERLNQAFKESSVEDLSYFEKKWSQANRILSKLEGKLNFEVDGIKGNLDEDKYDAAVSYVGLKFLLKNNEIVNEIHKIGNHGINQSKDYKVYEYEDEYGLINGVIDSFKSRKVYCWGGYNNPYDVVSLREASKRTKANSFDIGIKGKLPRRDVVRDMYQRLRFYSQENIDKYRVQAIFHPYLRSSNPKGNLKLESVVNYHYPNSFHKSITYEELRELEIKAINGDKESAQKIVDYLIDDVESVKRLLDIPYYLETLFKIKEIMPHVPITEIAFSPNSMLELHKKRHFEDNHNQMIIGYEEKIRENETQITKKRLKPYKKTRLRKAGINTKAIPGIFKDVYQIYVPLEEFVKEAALIKFPELSKLYDYLASLGNVQQFGGLQYAKAFLQEYFIDYLTYRKEKNLLEKNINTSNLEDKVQEVFRTVDSDVNLSLLDKYYSSYDNLKNLYRSFYVRNSESVRAKIRVKDKIKHNQQLELGFSDLFKDDNYDLIKLREIELRIEDEFSERLLEQFKKTFSTLESTKEEIKEEVNLQDFDNMIYLYCLNWRVDRKKKRFYARFGLNPDGENSFQQLIHKGYGNLGKELREKNLSVILHKNDYLYVVSNNGNEVNNLKYAKVIRKIPEFNTKLRTENFEMDDLLENGR